MTSAYELKRSELQFMWNLKAANGEIILTSERYVSREAAKIGINSCRLNSGIDARYERRTSSSRQPYFVLRGANYETIGTSEMYSSISAMEQGIQSCKVNGPTAAVIDLT